MSDIQSKSYEQIVITGCSHSCGMEMNDHLLGSFNTFQERQAQILKWGKEHYESESTDIKAIKDCYDKKWREKETQNSWPSLLHGSVINLATIGASLSHSLVSYSAFLKNDWKNKKTVVIHQVPELGRMYIRFNKEFGRVDIVPGSVDNFGYDSKFFFKEINDLQRKYKQLIANKDYIEKHQEKLLRRISKLSQDRNIQDFYIFNSPTDVPSWLKDKTILNNFNQFRKQYAKGKFGHIIDPNYNIDMANCVREMI